MFLLISLRICILAIASFVVWSSVTGLGALFSSIAVPVMFAAAALDLSKYVAVSFAYQYWVQLNMVERFSVIAFVSVLMVFTSAGVFSYLGQNYQNSYAAVDAVSTERQELERQLSEVTSRISELERQVTALPSNMVVARIKLMKAHELERAPLLERRASITAALSKAVSTEKQASAHAGPITYLAKVFSTTVENASTVVVAALTLCLDPFALFLTIMMNKLTILLRIKKKLEHEPYTDATTVEPEPAQAPPTATEYIVPPDLAPTHNFVVAPEPAQTTEVRKRRVWNTRATPLKRRTTYASSTVDLVKPPSQPVQQTADPKLQPFVAKIVVNERQPNSLI